MESTLHNSRANGMNGDDNDGEEKESTRGKRIVAYKRRLLHTAVYYFGYFVFGWVIGQRGAVFLDLLLVTGTDVSLGSILFTLAALASIAGALAGGFLLDATARPVLMMTCVFVVNAVVNSTMALCTSLALMSILFFLSHFGLSIYDVVVNPQLANMWPGGASGGFLQGLHFSFAVGAFLSPLATQPFLAPRSKDTHLIPIKELELDQSKETEMYSSVPLNFTLNSTIQNTTVAMAVEDIGTAAQKETRVFYALLISGVLCLIASMLMIMLMMFPVQKLKHSQESAEENEMPKKLRKIYYAAIVMLGVYNFFGSSVEDVFPHYLMTFVVRELDWSKSSGAHITSVYWIGLSLGRLSGVVLLRVLSPTKIIFGCLTSMIASLLALLLAAMFRAHWAVWVSAAAVGLSASVLFPTGLTYAHEKVARLTGRLSALIFTTPMMAAMANPMLLALLITRYDDMWYVYIFLLQAAVALGCFLVLNVLASRLSSAREKVYVMRVEMEESTARETTRPFLDKPEAVSNSL